MAPKKADTNINIFTDEKTVNDFNALFAKETVQTLMVKDLYIIDFNIACMDKRIGKYHPNEVAVLKFSIKDGIKDFYHNFINPGKTPVGCGFQARDLYDNFHGIPEGGIFNHGLDSFSVDGDQEVSEEELYLNSLKETFQRINKFIKHEDVGDVSMPRGSIRPVFSYGGMNSDGLMQSYGCLQQLASETGNSSILESFQILDIIHLLKFAARITSEDNDRSYAEFDSNFGIKILDPSLAKCCDFHKEIENSRCTLSRSHVIAYIFMDIVVPMYGVTITDKHKPPPPRKMEFDKQWGEEAARIFEGPIRR